MARKSNPQGLRKFWAMLRKYEAQWQLSWSCGTMRTWQNDSDCMCPLVFADYMWRITNNKKGKFIEPLSVQDFLQAGEQLGMTRHEARLIAEAADAKLASLNKNGCGWSDMLSKPENIKRLRQIRRKLFVVLKLDKASL